MSAEPGKLPLGAGVEPPPYITVSKTFTVNVDETPFFVVKVADTSDDGTVKLIRKDPYDKRVAIRIDRPGLYAVDMRNDFGWKGKISIETCLYAIGDEEEITYAFVKFAEALTQEEQELIKNRAAGGNVRLSVARFEIVPLFNACGFYFRSSERPRLSASYRLQNGGWLKALQPVYVPEDGMYRGSIVDLAEDAAYELRILGENGHVLAQQSFRTWRTEVPVAKTIVLDENNFTGHLKLRESGTPDGWLWKAESPAGPSLFSSPSLISRRRRLTSLFWRAGVPGLGTTLS